MDKQVMMLKKNLLMTVLIVILALIFITGASLAWFSNTGAEANIIPMGGTVSNGQAELKISNSYDGPYLETCELVLIGEHELLRPISTADLETFSQGAGQNPEGITLFYCDATDVVDRDTVHGIVYLRSEGGISNVYLNESQLYFGSDIQAIAAMRLGLKITAGGETITYFFKLDDLENTLDAEVFDTISSPGSVVASVSDSIAEFVDDPSVDMYEYFAVQSGDKYYDGQTPLIVLQEDEIATVEFWIYLEGCDENCFNPVQNKESELRLGFAGVDAEMG